MQDEVVYNQIITFVRDTVDCRTIVKSYVEEGKLILVLEDSLKLLIDGRYVDTTGRKDRIQELLSSARSAGVALDDMTVAHYASSRNEEEPIEYVLIKW
jgi:hypothetical protein